MRKVLVLVLVMAGLAIFFSPYSASAHSTGQERRTAAQCYALQNPRWVRACLRCISRPIAHHFHPENPRSLLCRPSNGLP